MLRSQIIKSGVILQGLIKLFSQLSVRFRKITIWFLQIVRPELVEGR